MQKQKQSAVPAVDQDLKIDFSQDLLGIDALERMLDEFDGLYQTSKDNLLPSLLSVPNFIDRKLVLDSFFDSLELKANSIQGHDAYRAFKNFY
jgi:hypothetical protein